jgi:hypothetical protein
MKTNRDVMATVLSEVTGRSVSDVQEILSVVPKPNNLDEVISEGQYEQTLNDMRKEKPGILNWLLEGYAMATKRRSEMN